MAGNKRYHDDGSYPYRSFWPQQWHERTELWCTFTIALQCGHEHIAVDAMPKPTERLYCVRCRDYRKQA